MVPSDCFTGNALRIGRVAKEEICDKAINKAINNNFIFIKTIVLEIKHVNYIMYFICGMKVPKAVFNRCSAESMNTTC